MPNNIVIDLIRKVAKIEGRLESLMNYQKWQMGILAAIFVAVVVSRVR